MTDSDAGVQHDPWGAETAEQSPGALQSSGLTLLLSLAAHCSGPQVKGLSPGGLDASGANLWARRKCCPRVWCWGTVESDLGPAGCVQPVPFCWAAALNCFHPSQTLPATVPSSLPSANCSLLQGVWCQPAGQLPRDQLSALIQRLALLQVPLQAWQLSCLANLASRCGLQDDFTLHPPNLLLFYNLSQVREVDCRAFIRRAAQGDVELLSHLPDQRVALQRVAVGCLAGARPQLSASNLPLLGALVCDMDASSISAADPHVLENLQRCPRLTTAQRIALNSLLAGGKTSLGPPGSWTLEGLQALGSLATYISPHLWAQVQEAVGLGFFSSMVAACRAGRLSQHEARRFVTSFLESKTKLVSSRPRLSTGRSCVRGNITAATLRDNLFLVHYDCAQLESCLDGHVLRTNLEPLLQHPLPTECQRVVKAKLEQIYPQGLPEYQLRLITSLVYLYSCTEIGQWSITSRDTVVALLASDVALENQTEVRAPGQAGRWVVPSPSPPHRPWLCPQARLHSEVLSGCEFGGTLFTPGQRVRGKLWLRKGGPCPAVGRVGDWWPTPQPPASPRLAGALDVSSCPQSRKDVLYAKAREAFSSSSRTPAAYYHFMRPYLGGAPVEELQHLAQANISMDIDTFTSLNPRVLQSLDVSNVTALLGHNVGDLQKARSHPTVRSWLYSLNSSALGQLGLDASPAGPTSPTGPSSPTGPAHGTSGPPSTTHQAPHLVHTSGLPGNAAQASTSGSPWAPLGYLPLAVALPSSLLWLLHWGTCTLASVDIAASGWLGSQGSGAGKTGLLDSAGRPLGLRGRL
ncbi:PREDICTED: mesothelin-like protein [Cercocebus atys]|uniref:mesothelin-like protein n=1 Tax=Cercocebus atys TaxID=9531 RepID=UPI0005F526B2|nr:PREDICTED: mesothelin-like protein [Cercocebus atys]